MSEPGLRLVPAHGGPDVDPSLGRVARGDARPSRRSTTSCPRRCSGWPAAWSATRPGPRTSPRRSSSRSGARPLASTARLGKAKTWVMTIAHRRAVDAVRRNESQQAAGHEGRARRGQPRRAGRRRDPDRGARRSPRVHGDADRPAARVGPAGVLQRLHLQRGGDSAGQAASHHQDEDARRTDPSARLPGGSTMSTDLHTLSGAYCHRRAQRRGGQLVRAPISSSARPAATRSASCRRPPPGWAPVEVAAPPAALKARVLAAADQQPQLPPKVHLPGSRRRRSAAGPALAAAAAAAVLVVAGGPSVSPSWAGATTQAPLAAAVSQVFQATDAHTRQGLARSTATRPAWRPRRAATRWPSTPVASAAGQPAGLPAVDDPRGTRPTRRSSSASDVRGASMAMPSYGYDGRDHRRARRRVEQPTHRPDRHRRPGSV